MGSLFTKMPEDIKVQGYLGQEIDVPFYLQFVPGIVLQVVTGKSSQKYHGDRSINTIIAKPHLSNDPLLRTATIGEKNRYYPLLRGMVDTPTKGDPVLLCTIGKINYYLGPLNTDNNPNWNNDNLKKLEQEMSPRISTDATMSETELKGESIKAYVTLMLNITESPEVESELKTHVRNVLSPIAVTSAIDFLPLTI